MAESANPKDVPYGGVMQGSPPPPELRTTLQNWDRPPFNRWSFQNVRSVIPTRAVARGSGHALKLGRAEQDLSRISFVDQDGRTRTVGDLLASTYTDGFLVLHGGRIIAETYMNGMGPGSLHLSQSVAKSIVGTLVGIYVERGVLDLNAPVMHYVPELATSGYRDALLWHVLDMRSGVKFSEDYLDPECEIGLLDRATGWKAQRDPTEPQCTYEVILSLKQVRPHGGQFEYRSIETEVLGWVLERVTGRGLADLLSEEIWQPMGADADASITVDSAGSCTASGGFNATLRDYGRFGQLLLNNGNAGDRQIVPENWIKASSIGDRAAFGAYYSESYHRYPQAAYSKQWWVLDPERGLISGFGIFGQMLLIDQARRLVAVKLSTWPDPLNEAFRASTLLAVEAIGRELTGK